MSVNTLKSIGIIFAYLIPAITLISTVIITRWDIRKRANEDGVVETEDESLTTKGRIGIIFLILAGILGIVSIVIQNRISDIEEDLERARQIKNEITLDSLINKSINLNQLIDENLKRTEIVIEQSQSISAYSKEILSEQRNTIDAAKRPSELLVPFSTSLYGGFSIRSQAFLALRKELRDTLQFYKNNPHLSSRYSCIYLPDYNRLWIHGALRDKMLSSQLITMHIPKQQFVLSAYKDTIGVSECKGIPAFCVEMKYCPECFHPANDPLGTVISFEYDPDGEHLLALIPLFINWNTFVNNDKKAPTISEAEAYSFRLNSINELDAYQLWMASSQSGYRWQLSRISTLNKNDSIVWFKK